MNSVYDFLELRAQVDSRKESGNPENPQVENAFRYYLVFKMMNFVLKPMNFVLKMMNFVQL